MAKKKKPGQDARHLLLRLAKHPETGEALFTEAVPAGEKRPTLLVATTVGSTVLKDYLSELVGTMRAELGLSQRQLGETLGKSQQWIAGIEAGRQMPPLELLLTLLVATGRPTDSLFGGLLSKPGRQPDSSAARSKLRGAIEMLNQALEDLGGVPGGRLL